MGCRITAFTRDTSEEKVKEIKAMGAYDV